MFDFLYQLPDFLIAVFFGLVMFILIAGVPRVVRQGFKMERNNDTSDFAVRGQATVITFLAIVLGFCLVNAQGSLRDVEAKVSREANSISQLDRLMLRYGDPKVTEIRPLLAAYAESIVTNEWPLLQDTSLTQTPNKTSQAFGQVTRAMYPIEPAAGRQREIYNQILRSIDELQEMRAERIDAANTRLPAAFWEIILALFLLLILLATLIEPTPGRSLAIGGQALAVALLLSLVFIYDVPFKGQTSVKPTAIVKVIATIKNRTN